MQIDGISVVYFQFMHLLGRPRYVGDVYLYLCTEVRVLVCVLCCMWDENEGKGEGETWCRHIAYSCQ